MVPIHNSPVGEQNPVYNVEYVYLSIYLSYTSLNQKNLFRMLTQACNRNLNQIAETNLWPRKLGTSQAEFC